MPAEMQQSDFLKSDVKFDRLYDFSVRKMSARHWTPLPIVKLSVDFLAVNPGSNILDIGSGAGKFCLGAACYAPKNHFFGIEQRGYLIDHALEAKKKLGIKNTSFIEGNFTQLDLRDFNHFYFYNSFYENLDEFDKIDDSISHSEGLYTYYSRFLHHALKSMPIRTRIVTYHSFNEEIPREYKLVETLEGGDLKFWIKESGFRMLSANSAVHAASSAIKTYPRKRRSLGA